MAGMLSVGPGGVGGADPDVPADGPGRSGSGSDGGAGGSAGGGSGRGPDRARAQVRARVRAWGRGRLRGCSGGVRGPVRRQVRAPSGSTFHMRGRRRSTSSARAPGVWPCARPCALVGPFRERLHGCCVGRPAATGLSGLGDTAASFPAGGGPVRGASTASRTVRGPVRRPGAGAVSGTGFRVAPRAARGPFPGLVPGMGEGGGRPGRRPAGGVGGIRGNREGSGNEVGRKGASDVTSPLPPGFNAP